MIIILCRLSAWMWHFPEEGSRFFVDNTYYKISMLRQNRLLICHCCHTRREKIWIVRNFCYFQKGQNWGSFKIVIEISKKKIVFSIIKYFSRHYNFEIVSVLPFKNSRNVLPEVLKTKEMSALRESVKMFTSVNRKTGIIWDL